jgi:hypothetical protein
VAGIFCKTGWSVSDVRVYRVTDRGGRLIRVCNSVNIVYKQDGIFKVEGTVK